MEVIGIIVGAWAVIWLIVLLSGGKKRRSRCPKCKKPYYKTDIETRSSLNRREGIGSDRVVYNNTIMNCSCSSCGNHKQLTTGWLRLDVNGLDTLDDEMVAWAWERKMNNYFANWVYSEKAYKEAIKKYEAKKK